MTLAPTVLASATTWRTSTRAPVTLETWAREISLVLGVISFGRTSMSMRPSTVTGTMSSSIPDRDRKSCHGTMLE
jgi:hypothetical protein